MISLADNHRLTVIITNQMTIKIDRIQAFKKKKKEKPGFADTSIGGQLGPNWCNTANLLVGSKAKMGNIVQIPSQKEPTVLFSPYLCVYLFFNFLNHYLFLPLSSSSSTPLPTSTFPSSNHHTGFQSHLRDLEMLLLLLPVHFKYSVH